MEEVIKTVWIDTIHFVNLGSESSGNITDVVGAGNTKYISSDMFLVVPTSVNGSVSQYCDRDNASAWISGVDLTFNVSYNSRTGDYTIHQTSNPQIYCRGNWGSASSSSSAANMSVGYNVYLVVW